MKKNVFKKLLVLASALTLMACGGEKKGEEAATAKKGDIVLTVITQRTDLAATVFPEYAKKFIEANPEVKEVLFEAPDDYEGSIKTRMNTKDYGDVLLVPGTMTNAELPNYFASLGSVDEVGAVYQGFTKIVDGQVYGIPTNINAGATVLYNKEAFAKAGITSFPKNPTELYEAAKKLKAAGVIPLYTNYAAKWPFGQWDGGAIAAAANQQYKLELVKDPAPFTPGKPYYELYKIMYEMAKNKYIEEDPITSDWDSSKQMMADGKIGMMVLGTWAYPQITALTDKKDSIGLGLIPLPAADGNNYLPMGGDYNIAINKHSKNIDAAKKFVNFFLRESGYVQNYGVISPDKTAKNPQYVEELLASVKGNVLPDVYNPRPEEEEKFKNIQNNSGIDLQAGDAFKQEIIDAGLQGKSFDEIMNKMNEKWGKEVNKK